MIFFQRMTWVLLWVCLAVPGALAGPNAGGVLVVHTTDLVYTLDQPSYMGLSGIACGQDGPPLPQTPVCPPYDPAGSCNVGAANPTSAQPVDVAQIWFVLAAFPPESCPRLKATTFGIDYDSTRVVISTWGFGDESFVVLENSQINSNKPWPYPASSVGWSYGLPLPLGPSTSRLLEICWFAGYAYAGSGDLFFQVTPHPTVDNRYWIDDSTPVSQDPIMGYGKLGLAGTVGVNPSPVQSIACCVGTECRVLTPAQCTAASGVNAGVFYCTPDLCPISPVEETSWGQVKYQFSR